MLKEDLLKQIINSMEEGGGYLVEIVVESPVLLVEMVLPRSLDNLREDVVIKYTINLGCTIVTNVGTLCEQKEFIRQDGFVLVQI